MTPLEAWSIISGNLAHLYRLRRTTGYQGYGPKDTEAEVIAFKALQEKNDRINGKSFLGFSQLVRIAKLYRSWLRNNQLVDGDSPETVIAFLQMNGILDIVKAWEYIESHKEVNADV